MLFQNIKRLSFRHKNNKPLYYLKGYSRLVFPNAWYRRQRDGLLKSIDRHPRKDRILERVNYYCKDFDTVQLPHDDSVSIGDMSIKELGAVGKVYFFDTYEYLRYFDPSYRFIPLFGDITTIPTSPSFTKSRPICGNNANSVIMKLDKIRHFTFVNDTRLWTEKKPILIGRTKAYQKHRQRFLSLYHEHPMCDVGQVNVDINPQYVRPRLTIDEHLDYKFILCLEGNDVASNLKWVMSSNSLAVSTPLVYETWFMEGYLRPNEHFVAIKPDYSDLPDRLQYYLDHPKEAQEIIDHAHAYVSEMRKDEDERLCSLLILDKYFGRTAQL